MTDLFLNYAIHIFSALVLLFVFTILYVKFTPYDEFALIKQGHLAAALSLGGSLLGFALTLASSIAHSDTWLYFVLWSGLSAVVQLALYAFLSRSKLHVHVALADNNIAMGAFVGMLAIAVGLLNAACLT